MVLDTITRRQIIAGGIASVFLPVSGCTTITKPFSEPELGLGRITVENGDDVPHTIHVTVERDGELIYGSSHDLEAVSEPQSDDSFGSIDGEILDDASWANETGNWTIYTRVDDSTSWDQHAITTDAEVSCYAVRLVIETDASVTGFTPDCGSWPPNENSTGNPSFG